MIGRISRIVGGILWIILTLLLASLVLSVALSSGALDLGLEEGDRIETPEPVPDWPFVWEVPVEEGHTDSGTPAELENESAVGEPITDDPGTSSVGTGEDERSSAAIEAAVHERINEIRTDADLDTLDHDDEIASISRTYSHDMAVRGYFSHTSPEGEGPADRFGDLYPRPCHAVGENLAFVSTAGTVDADAIADRIVDGWMDSEGHRDNVLTPEWDSQGIGVYIHEDRAYATQKFCSR